MDGRGRENKEKGGRDHGCGVEMSVEGLTNCSTHCRSSYPVFTQIARYRASALQLIAVNKYFFHGV